jgi:hypothetical protein
LETILPSDYEFEPLNETPPSVSLAHFVQVLQRYRLVILVALASAAIAYLFVATAILLMSPAERLTTQPFRLDFEGAGNGRYPNGMPFNVMDVITGPVLLKVHQSNRLAPYVNFGDFSRSVFVLESNREYEVLAAEYGARLADPKLTAVDRERLQREFQLKRESISKNAYTLNYIQRLDHKTLPEAITRKVLLDILKEWADFAVNQQRVTTYQVSLLSPDVVKDDVTAESNLIVTVNALRTKAVRTIENVVTIANLPGASLAHTPNDNMSLEELRLRLEELIRFRLEPLVDVIRASGLASDPAGTVRFVETQLAYDQRQLQAALEKAEAARQALSVYEAPAAATSMVAASRASQNETRSPATSEAIMPQLSDTFLDRLLTLSGRSADVQYRQRLVDDYKRAVEATIPFQQNVAYDNQLLKQVTSGAPGSRLDPALVRARIEGARSELRRLITKVNELFVVLSQNMSPSSQLFTVTSAPSTRTVRPVPIERLLLYGVLLLLLALPLIVVLCYVHARIKEEESAEAGRPRSAQG